jgi:hypothetical protein
MDEKKSKDIDLIKKKITLKPKKEVDETDSKGKTINGLIYVSRQYKTVGEEEHEETDEDIIEVHEFKTEPARVNLKYGLTMNMGNYESVRVDVGVDIPCYIEEIDEAYKKAQDFVIKKINQEKAEVKGEESFDDNDDDLYEDDNDESFDVEEDDNDKKDKA